MNTSIPALRNPAHVYETPGTYTVILMVRNLGVTGTLTRADYITVITPPETSIPTTSPTPVPTLTDTPTPDITLSPTVTPTSSPTPSLTPTPAPTLTISPTPVITLVPTVTPTSSPTPLITPIPTPTVTSAIDIPAPGEGSGSTDDIIPSPSPTPVAQVAGLAGCQTVTVGGDSAITRVMVTGEDIDDIIVTARTLADLPPGITPPDGQVYQYIDIVPARYRVISGALIEFDLPFISVDGPGDVKNNVSLCMLKNRTWVCLPSFPAGTRNGRAVYRAEGPEFSIFAITIQNGTSESLPTDVPTVSPEPQTFTTGESRESVLSALPKTPEKGSGGSGSGFSRVVLIAGIVGSIGIAAVFVLLRHRKVP